jgi:TIR domain-containing protein
MTQIFVSHSSDDAACAEHIRLGLEAKGYSTWRESSSLTMESILYPRTIENVILSSVAVILVWSSRAAQSEWVQRHLLFAQRLKKLVVPVVIDGTDLPPTLIIETVIASQVPCADVVKQLPPDFPQPDSTDLLIKLSEQAAHEFIHERKEAIDLAAEMLKQNEHREEVLAIVAYLARNDLMMGVRDKAQEVLDTDAKRGTPPPPFLHPNDSRHIIGVRCKQCGHITYFDRRRICSAQSHFVRTRTTLAGKELDKFDLPCEKCRHIIPTRVDCEGY